MRLQLCDSLALVAMIAIQTLLQCLELLPRMVDLFMGTFLDRTNVLLGFGALEPQCAEITLLFIQLQLQTVTLLRQVGDLGSQLVDQNLALGELALRQGSLCCVFGDTCLGFGKGDVPHLAFLGQCRLFGKQCVLLSRQGCLRGALPMGKRQTPRFGKGLGHIAG
ncbi:MAG: hypothetical protein RSP_15580 [Rhodanobacter sp.]